MPTDDQPHRHGHPGQKEARSHGETHHEMRQVNLNTAAQAEIEDLPMVGPKRAAALVAARPFKTWEDVAAVEGMSLGMIDDLRSGGAEIG